MRLGPKEENKRTPGGVYEQIEGAYIFQYSF